MGIVPEQCGRLLDLFLDFVGQTFERTFESRCELDYVH